ncbi:MAG TPA: ABC transporter permease [Vicinamibacterales bacterium]|nr:ABC transporter permease [Vicinamibacterales bacterium]
MILTSFLTDVRRDLALGVRLLARYPGFSAVSIATLAIAIGGNTAVFTIVNALLLTPPPVSEPGRLVRVYPGQSLTSWPVYEDIRDRAGVFSSVAAYRLTSMNLDQGGTAIRLRGQITSANYLTLLGVRPHVGDTYRADDATAASVVLAHHVWRQRFGSDPAIVGRTLVLGGRSVQVSGVMADGFRGTAPPGFRLDFWMPLDPRRAGDATPSRLLPQFEVVARLKPGIEREAATAALRTVASQLRREYPELPESLAGIDARPLSGVHAFQGMISIVWPIFAFLFLLTIVSGFVLVIGCSNIAGLLVGRAALRQREIAVRLSLGSSRGRLVRQLLTESLVLAGAGGVAGLLLAAGLVGFVELAIQRMPFPLHLDLALDRRVLAYAIALSTATAVLFGLLPARQAARVDLTTSLKADSSGSPERRRLRRAMVALQVAVCSALIVWSVLFVRSLGRIHAIEPGFDSTGVVLGTVEIDRSLDAARGDQILSDWTRRVGASPGVHSAALATIVPLALTGREEFDVSLPADAAGRRRRVLASRVSPGWFATLRIPLLAGRDFTWEDRRGALPVAIVNDTLARQFWNGAALGQLVRYGSRTLEVVGVVRDSKYRTLGEAPAPVIYLPIRQQYSHFVTMHVRTSDPRGTAALMASELGRLWSGAEVQIESMSDAVAVAVLPARIGALVTGGFGALAVALAAFGVYGLVSFTVVQRAREIGIRRAVGATAADVLRLVLRQHAGVIGAGLTVGVAAGALGGTVLRSFLAGVGPADPPALAAAVVVVAGSAFAATVAPALRAARLDPMAVLRDG